MIVSHDFRLWIAPLLEYPEDEIFLKHITRDGAGIFIAKNAKRACEKYNLSIEELFDIVQKIEGLARMFELTSVAFPHRFYRPLREEI